MTTEVTFTTDAPVNRKFQMEGQPSVGDWLIYWTDGKWRSGKVMSRIWKNDVLYVHVVEQENSTLLALYGK